MKRVFALLTILLMLTMFPLSAYAFNEDEFWPFNGGIVNPDGAAVYRQDGDGVIRPSGEKMAYGSLLGIEDYFFGTSGAIYYQATDSSGKTIYVLESDVTGASYFSTHPAQEPEETTTDAISSQIFPLNAPIKMKTGKSITLKEGAGWDFPDTEYTIPVGGEFECSKTAEQNIVEWGYITYNGHSGWAYVDLYGTNADDLHFSKSGTCAYDVKSSFFTNDTKPPESFIICRGNLELYTNFECTSLDSLIYEHNIIECLYFGIDNTDQYDGARFFVKAGKKTGWIKTTSLVGGTVLAQSLRGGCLIAASDGMPLYSGCTEDTKTAETIPSGTIVYADIFFHDDEITTPKADWCRIIYNGKYYWIFGDSNYDFDLETTSFLYSYCNEKSDIKIHKTRDENSEVVDSLKLGDEFYIAYTDTNAPGNLLWFYVVNDRTSGWVLARMDRSWCKALEGSKPYFLPPGTETAVSKIKEPETSGNTSEATQQNPEDTELSSPGMEFGTKALIVAIACTAAAALGVFLIIKSKEKGSVLNNG